jgi:hypothetical protein
MKKVVIGYLYYADGLDSEDRIFLKIAKKRKSFVADG